MREPRGHTAGRTDRSGARRHRWRRFVVVTFALLVLMAGPTIPTPLYPVYAQVFALSPLVITLVFAVYALVVIPALLVFGALSDVIGRRRVLLPAVGMAVAGSVLFAAASGPGWLFAARAVQGLAVGAAQGTASAALTDADPDANTARSALVSSLAVVGGIAAGPLVGGLLGEYGPAPRVAPYLVEIVLLVVAGLAMMRLLPPDSGTGATWRPTRPSVPAPIRGTFVLAGISAFVAFSANALFLTLMPAFVAQLTGISNLALAGGVVALMLGFAGLVLLQPRRLTVSHGQTIGLVLLAAGLAGLLAAAQTRSIAVVIASAIVTGLGQGLAFGGSLAAVNSVAPSDRRGEILSSYYVVVYLGLALPIIGVGFIALVTGQLVAVEIFACAVIAACTVGLLAHGLQTRRARRRHAA